MVFPTAFPLKEQHRDNGYLAGEGARHGGAWKVFEEGSAVVAHAAAARPPQPLRPNPPRVSAGQAGHTEAYVPLSHGEGPDVSHCPCCLSRGPAVWLWLTHATLKPPM